MFWKIFLFELRYRMRRPATYAYFSIIFLFAFLSGIYGNSPASEKVFVNSSYAIGYIIVFLSIFEMLIASAIMGVPVYRDIEYNTKDYFFTYPITEKSYLLGRYAGSFVVLLFVSLGFHFGNLLGTPLGVLTGEIEPDQYGPVVPYYYLYNTLLLGVPNLFFTGTLFFSLVALTRKIVVTYVGSVILFVGYLLANALMQDLDNRTLADLLDPFALRTFTNATRYWTPSEQNTMLLPIEGTFLWNRVLWIGVSLAIFAFTYFRFSFASMMNVPAGKKAKDTSSAARITTPLAELPVASRVFSNRVFVRKMIRMASLEFRNVVKDFYFMAILLAGVLFLFLDGWFGSPTMGTPALPLTYYMLEVKDYDYIIFVFIILIFYTGEVVHRDRAVNYSNIADALPVPNWVIYGSKLVALLMISFMLVNLVLVSGLLNQILKGYFNFEFSMYFTDLYLIELPEYIELVMLAFIVHILVNNKFVGHVVSIGIWVMMFLFRNLAEADYNLLFYSYTPNYVISDMNGFGHFFKPLGWFNAFWLCLGAIFLIVGNLFWNRGSEPSFSARKKLARQRLSTVAATSLALLAVAWLSIGSYIYYNVSVLNTYRTGKESKQIGADFEKQYAKYEFFPQPKVIDVKVAIDIFPETRSSKARATYILVNKSDQPIDTLILNAGSPVYHTTFRELSIDGKTLTLVKEDKLKRFYFYTPAVPIAPNDTLPFTIEMDLGYQGFTNSGYNREIVYNGTFFDLSVFPSFGYPGDPLSSDKDRKKYGLPKKDYIAPPQDDPWGLSHLLFNDDADFITFDAVLSTSPDQIAVAPGYLTKTWEENGRKYFHYAMDSKIEMFFNISSARYAVHRDKWESPSGQVVNIEIFHHPTHTYNLDRYVNSIKSSMDYFTKYFSPYQHKQMRILEFPRYAGFAQSFPNTVPYSESFGWIADNRDPDDTDYTYYVTAHEVAHQWWGHQVSPSATRGANQLSESMAEYSSLMVLEHAYGKDCMQNRLKYSLDRYLRGRAGEDKFEATLLDNDSRAYVWYDKGSLVLYALQDLIGEERLNGAFRKFIDTAAFREQPPFPTANEWYGYIKEATPDSVKYFIEDAFEKITLYENRLIDASYRKDGDGYKVTLRVNSRKVYYDGLGGETGTGQSKDLIDIGIFTEDGKNDKGMKEKRPLYLKKHWLQPGEQTIEIFVKTEPKTAGIDPYNKLIDRIPDDNTKSVSEGQ
ncbi:MAG TPA: M1 family aminopeptidase [Chryseolinea sp.]|nr:M1 family aminopeptidase [Chryseolinea sp.]